jgi:hypothetical protein
LEFCTQSFENVPHTCENSANNGFEFTLGILDLEYPKKPVKGNIMLMEPDLNDNHNRQGPPGTHDRCHHLIINVNSEKWTANACPFISHPDTTVYLLISGLVLAVGACHLRRKNKELNQSSHKAQDVKARERSGRGEDL